MIVTAEELLRSARQHGYLMVPARLVEGLLNPENQEDTLRLITVLFEVNFKDQKMRFGEREIVCRRGESMRSIRNWAEKLGCTPQEATEFFERLRELGFLEELPYKRHSGHIKVARYELLTGKLGLIHTPEPERTPQQIEEEEKERKRQENEQRVFDSFWERYHRITGMIPSEKSYASYLWSKLTVEEQDMAHDNIEIYYNALPDKRKCRKATMYLKFKSFN